MENNNKNDLFDVITLLFTNKSEFDKLSDITLNRNAFMINRILGIKYPMQSQAFNCIKINSCDVIKFWADYLGGQPYVPNFVRTRGVKKSADILKKKKSISENDIKTFCVYNNISRKDINAALEMFNSDMVQEITSFINSINEK